MRLAQADSRTEPVWPADWTTVAANDLESGCNISYHSYGDSLWTTKPHTIMKAQGANIGEETLVSNCSSLN